MKTLSIVTVAILLGLSGAAMAGGDDESQEGSTNATGPDPFMPEFSTPVRQGGADMTHGYSAFARYPVRHHFVRRHVEKEPLEQSIGTIRQEP
jgi:hypothetical protein